MYRGCVVFVLKLPLRSGSSGILRLINPFSGTYISFRPFAVVETLQDAKSAKAKKIIDLARVEFSAAPFFFI